MAGGIKDLAAYRFERANEELTNAKDLLAEGKYKLSMNRSYYAVFHAMRSVNTLDGFDSSKHSGVIAHFNQYHVKNGDFPKDTSKRIGQASSMRIMKISLWLHSKRQISRRHSPNGLSGRSSST